MLARASLLLLAFATACGYTIGATSLPGGVRLIRVVTTDTEGLDVDAAGLVSSAVRRAIAEGPSTRLATGSAAEARLTVRLLDSGATLLPLADPGVRAAQYRAEVRLEATLESEDGRLLWRSGPITGEAPFFSIAPTERIETLDGARRRALQHAADSAATRLVSALTHGPL